MMTLDDFLRSNGFSEAIGLPLDGQFHRYGRRGSQSSGWFRGHVMSTGNAVARFGDWRTGESFEYLGQTHATTPGEAEAMLAELARIAQEERRVKQERQEASAKECQELWEQGLSNQESPYMTAKGFPHASAYKEWGLRVDTESEAAKKWGPQTLVSARDIRGYLWGIQRISKDGFKSFKEGMRIKGCFFDMPYPDPKLVDCVVLCEGIATAASIQAALGGRAWVLSCFNAGNLKHVAKAVREAHPSLRIVIAGDNDQWTTKPGTDGKDIPWNPGFESAMDAMQAVGGKNCAVVLPPFDSQDPEKRTDWNDWHLSHSLVSVAEHFWHWLHLPEEKADKEPGPGVPEKTPETPKPKKKDEDQPHLEWRLATSLLQTFDENLVRQEGSLFLYDGSRWRELDDREIDTIKNRINAMAGDKLPSKTVNSAFATFLRYVPSPPAGVNLFDPNPSAANFLDGTLHLKRDLGTGVYSMEFKPHDSRDFLTSVIPMNYKIDKDAKNELFSKLLSEAFEGDTDKDAKIKALQECGGAMLMAAFPQIFILHGKSGSRKSTLAKVLLKPLQKEGFSNVSFVDPSCMENFQVEGMIGKLVNCNTDIDDFKALPRGFIKRFEDNLPVQVNRKGKKVVNARLPSLHLYCANDLPPNYEKSKAFGRRVTIIGCDNDNGKKDSKFYEDLVFGAGPDAVLAFMLAGLERLVSQGGNFTVPASSKRAVEEWTEGYDPVASFATAIRAGDVGDKQGQVIAHSEAKIEQSRLWEIYQIWHGAEFPKATSMGRNKFFAAFERRGFARYRDRDTRWFKGLGTVEGGKSVM